VQFHGVVILAFSSCAPKLPALEKNAGNATFWMQPAMG
jgi:hypothetical protein